MIGSGESPEPPAPACIPDPYYNPGPTNDPYWASVVALFHFDGDYTDSSPVGAIYNVYGVSTTSSNARFVESLLVDSATTQGLESPLSADYDLESGDFTIELWVAPTSRPSVSGSIFLGVFDSAGNEEYSIRAFRAGFPSGDAFRGVYATGAATLAEMVGFDYSEGFWTHLALTREGNTYRFFCDGRKVATATNSYRRPTSDKYIRIGNRNPNILSQSTQGLYDEIRVTKGVARYTEHFAIPYNAYPNALETDWSPSDPRTVLSLRGEVKPHLEEILNVAGTTDATDSITYDGQVATPTFADVSAISYGPDGITFAVDGTNNYITYNAASKLYPAKYYDIIEYTATISYVGTLSGTGGTIEVFTVGNGIGTINYGFGFRVVSGVMTISLLAKTPTTNDASVTLTTPTTSVYTVRFNKKTQEITYILNGLIIRTFGSIATSTPPSIWPINGVRIGPNNQASRGGITGLVVKDFTVRTYPQEDNSGYQPQRFYPLIRTAKVDAEKKFGTTSYLSNNPGVTTPSYRYYLAITDELQFRTGDFTVELWAYRINNSSIGYLWNYDTTVDGYVAVDTSGQLLARWTSSGGGTTRSALASIPLNVWVHYAFQRKGTDLEIFVGGSLVDSFSILGGASATINPSRFVFGGSSGSDTTVFNGYIDEIRVTKGVARYTDPFVPGELPNCDDSDPGTLPPPTSGTEYPTGAEATTQQGAMTLLDHYQPLSGQSVAVTTGYTNDNLVPIPVTPTLMYTSASKKAIPIPGVPASVRLNSALIFLNTGNVVFNPSYQYSIGTAGGGTTGSTFSQWLNSTVSSGSGANYEIRLTPSYNVLFPPPLTPPGTQLGFNYAYSGIPTFVLGNTWESMAFTRALPLYNNFPTDVATQADYLDLLVEVRPTAASGLVGGIYEASYTIRIYHIAVPYK